MDIMDAIMERRSIRQFRSDPVPRSLVQQLLGAACQAPSSKNAQPWRFVVLEGKTRDGVVSVMQEAVLREERAGRPVGDSRATIRVMTQAPVVILVLNGLSSSYSSVEDSRFPRAVDVQSIGASIQNMLLAAVSCGLGTLWICDVLYAYEDILTYLGRNEELVAAVAIGYPAETPIPTLRRPLAQSVVWTA